MNLFSGGPRRRGKAGENISLDGNEDDENSKPKLKYSLAARLVPFYFTVGKF